MRKQKEKTELQLFFTFFKPHWKLFALDLSCALLVALVDLAFPLVSRAAMYDLLPNQKYHTFFVVMVIVVAAYLVRTVLYYILCYWGHTFGVRVEADIRQSLFRHLQTMGFDFLDRNRTGQLMSRLTSDLFELTELAHHGPEDILISVATIVGALIVMFRIQWRLALVVLVIVPLMLVVVIARRKAMHRASAAVKQKTAEINIEIESTLSGFRTAKAFANEAQERQKFDAANDRFRTSKSLFFREMGLFLASMELLISMLSVAIIAAGGWLIMRDQLDYRDLITFSLYVTTFINPIRKLANFSELFANGFAGLHRFAELMRTKPSIVDAPDAAETCAPEGEICLEHVGFSYDGELPVLRDVSLRVEPGQTVAIVGPSGGGKTTLCQLIPRFYDVTSGAITIDGVDVRHIAQDALHRSIGIVQQDVFLFAGSILENIRYGRPKASRAEVEEAARKAEIYDDICAMPQGFDTYVGERGSLLSGGQKQRISIARIFLKDPGILILDEATSALDSVTERKIQSAFDALAQGRTTLIIAHRLSTVSGADRIIVVENGRITESGRHAELMARDGTYSALYRTQRLLD